MKPVDINELQAALGRFVLRKETKLEAEALQRNQLGVMQSSLSSVPRQIALPLSDGYCFVTISNIVRCVSNKGYTRIIMKDGIEHFSSKSISDYASILEAVGFVRIHRSHLINLQCIKRFFRRKQASVLIVDGVEIMVAGNRKETLMQYFLKV
jgi:two-component system, LytTR family, response regulator